MQVSSAADTSCISTETVTSGFLLASGSEVQLALAAGKRLAARGVAVRVVSMPCLDVFDEQDEAYRERCCHPTSQTPGHRDGASDVVVQVRRQQGRVFGIDRFGASAPGDIVVHKYGFTLENVLSIAESVLNGQ